MNTEQNHPEFNFDPPVKRQKSKLREKFEKFHAENPRIYEELHDLALRYRESRGYKRIGISLLFEVARWHSILKTQGEDDFKLPNGWKPFYSRLLMLDPNLAGLFVTAKSAADEEVE